LKYILIYQESHFELISVLLLSSVHCQRLLLLDGLLALQVLLQHLLGGGTAGAQAVATVVAIIVMVATVNYLQIGGSAQLEEIFTGGVRLHLFPFHSSCDLCRLSPMQHRP
jgi:hypothetical protein